MRWSPAIYPAPRRRARAWSRAELERRACADGEFDAAGLRAAAAAVAGRRHGQRQRARPRHRRLARLRASATGCDLLGELRAAASSPGDGSAPQDAGDQEGRVASRRCAPSMQEQARLVRLCDQLRGLGVARRTEALLRVAFAAIDAYEALKARAAVARLRRPDRAHRRAAAHGPARPSGCCYKLDARIDHVLVDEAQDTSPRAVGDRRSS